MYNHTKSQMYRCFLFSFAHSLNELPADFCCTVTLAIACDDASYVYHDGDVVLSADGWRIAHTVNLDDACVLAVKAVDINSKIGLLASTSTGLMTDASWKCSGVEQTGWHLPGFDDAAWSQARVIATNDGSTFRGVIAGISTEAQWIWSQSNSNEIYCRKSVC